jgi:hypothetical protein
VLAGRHFPENSEGLLVGFKSAVLAVDQLSGSQGFRIGIADLRRHSRGRTWVALIRESAGSLDLFARIGEDLLRTIGAIGMVDDAKLAGAFIARIVAWQHFMRRSADEPLSPEAEVGLVGELEMLLQLITTGVMAGDSLEAWKGPLDGIHDFSFGAAAVEVKSTVSPVTFPAMIGSIKQLDDSLVRPIFVACVRLALEPSGRTLPELVAEVRHQLGGDQTALALFDSRLLHGGYVDAHGTRYSRKFAVRDMRVLRVSNTFPRLTRLNVPAQITDVKYEIDIDRIGGSPIDLAAALDEMGVRRSWS